MRWYSLDRDVVLNTQIAAARAWWDLRSRYAVTMAESDASSEMSDNALHKLVSRLVEAGGDLGEDEAENVRGPMHEHIADSDSADSSGSSKLLGAATGHPIWPSSSPDQPSPIQASRHSPLSDGMDRVAALLASAEASDTSSEGREVEALLPPAASTAREAEAEAEADSCGYEGDVGESTKSNPSVRRPAAMVVVAPPGISAKDGGDEADDEGSGKAPNKSHGHQQAASLNIKAARGRACFSRANSFGRKTGIGEELSHWDSLNETLREQGFRQVPLSRLGGALVVPDLASIADTLRDVVFQHGERGKIIQEMSLELNKKHQVAGHRDQLLNDSFRRERSDLSRRSAVADARVVALERERERLQEKLTKETRRLKSENANLASQLKHSEHRVKAKEAAAQGLMDKLRDEAEKERLYKRREGQLLKKFKHEGRRGGTNESSVAEVLSAQGRAQKRTQAEMDSLQAEVSRLGDELREKENTILRHRLGPDWIPGLEDSLKDPHGTGELREMRDRLVESERSVRLAKQREARALERCANIQKECEEVQGRVDETQESLVNAQLEIRSRPSLRNWRASQRRIQELEKKLAQTKTEAKEAVDVAELRRWVDTRELMRRDKGNHRLKLDRLDELPTGVMKQVLQDSCRLLALQDVSLLAPSVAKLTKAVQMLPRLERFVNRHSEEVLSTPADGSLSALLSGSMRTMEDVLPLLEMWLARAHEPVKLQKFHRGVLKALEKRAGQSQGSGAMFAKSDRAVVSAIQHLVRLECRSLEEVHLNEQADWSLNDDSELPVNRVVRHFQLLFAVKSVGGCIAKLNEVYRFSSETQTFLRMAGDLLDMPNATTEAVVKRLESVLEGRLDANLDACLRVSHEAESWQAPQTMEQSIEG